MKEENPPRPRYRGSGTTDARAISRSIGDQDFEFILTSHQGQFTLIVREGSEIRLAEGRRNQQFRFTSISRELFAGYLRRPLPFQRRKLVWVVHLLLNYTAQRSLHELHPWIPLGTSLPFEMVDSLAEACEKVGISRESLPFP